MSRICSRAMALVLIYMALLIAGATIARSQALQMPENIPAGNITQLPVSVVLQNAVDGQMQDIQENIFNYQFKAAGNNTAAQAALVEARSGQLANAVSDNERLMGAILASNGSIPDSRLAALAYQMNASLARIGNMSRQLQVRASGLTRADGRNGSIDMMTPLMGQLNYTMALDRQISGMANGAAVFKNGSDKGLKRSGHATFSTAYPVPRP